MHYEKTHRIVPRADSCGTGFNHKRREQSAKGTEQRTCKATEKELFMFYGFLDHLDKKKKKELEKDRWKIYGSSKTLEVALLEHYTKLYNDGEVAEEIIGTADNFKSNNVGRRQAVTNAQVAYAQRAGAQVKARIVEDIAANSADINAEFEHFYAAYEAQVQKEIGAELQESFTIVRPHTKSKKCNTYDMQVFFIISEDAATRARVRAYENALKESEAAQRYADRVSQFIQEGISPSAPQN